MDEKLKQNVTSGHIWLRLAYMLVSALILYVALAVFWLVSLVQFLFVLITGDRQFRLAQFNDILSTYIAECVRYISFSSDHKPFPFSDLPESTVVEPEQDAIDDEAIAQAAESGDSAVAEAEVIEVEAEYVEEGTDELADTDRDDESTRPA